jgi:hypothetical protein
MDGPHHFAISGKQMPLGSFPQDSLNYDFPTSHYDKMTSAGPHNRAFLLIGILDFAVPKCKCFLFSGFVKCRTLTSWIFDTHPKWMDGSNQTSVFFKCKIKLLTYVNPDGRISGFDDHATHVLPEIHGCDPFTVSGIKRSQTLGL